MGYNLKRCSINVLYERKITKRLSTRIKRHISKMNTEWRKVDCTQINKEFQLDIQWRTLNNWFIKSWYQYKNHLQKLMLTTELKLIRVKLVSQWIHEITLWKKCLFTDKKWLSLGGFDSWNVDMTIPYLLFTPKSFDMQHLTLEKRVKIVLLCVRKDRGIANVFNKLHPERNCLSSGCWNVVKQIQANR